mgnify:FL=1
MLYLHGLEEQASSPKPAALAADARIELHVPRLDIWLTRRNSPLLSALVVAAPGLLGICGAAYLAYTLALLDASTAAAGAIASAVAAGYACRGSLMARAVGRSVDVSYRIAVDALASFEPDIIVGFSWGGHLACRMVSEGLWTGGVLLLAPAHAKISTLTRRSPLLDVPLHPKRSRVVHSRADQLVPIDHSRQLCRAGVPLTEVDDEPHKLWAVAPQLADMVVELSRA